MNIAVSFRFTHLPHAICTTGVPSRPAPSASRVHHRSRDRRAHLQIIDVNVAAAITVRGWSMPVAGAFTPAAHLESP
jgi:hypothetical protein